MQRLFLLLTLLLVGIIAVGCSNSTEFDNCKTGDYKAERDCYTALAYNKVDERICEKMPEDVNERQANKAFCYGFIASTTGDNRICRNLNNRYYSNTCEIIYERFFMGFDPQFDELKEKYHSRTITSTGLLNSDYLQRYCLVTDSENKNKCVKNLENSDRLNDFDFALEICKGIKGNTGFECVVAIVEKADYKNYKEIIEFCNNSGSVFHVSTHFCLDPLTNYYTSKDFVDKDWLYRYMTERCFEIDGIRMAKCMCQVNSRFGESELSPGAYWTEQRLCQEPNDKHQLVENFCTEGLYSCE